MKPSLNITAKYSVLIFFVFCVIFYFATKSIEARHKRQGSAHSFSHTAPGLNSFYQILDRSDLKVSRFKKRFFDDPDALYKADVVIFSNPRAKISSQDAEVLKSYVLRGGDLVFFIEDSGFNPQVLQSFTTGSNRIWPDFALKHSPTFRNGFEESASIDSDQWIFNSIREYAFYSASMMSNDECRAGKVECYYSFKDYGKGTVHFMLGLSPFSNGLITKADNRILLESFMNRYKHVLIDEYHNFFISKNYQDLFLDSRFGLPILGFILILIAVFMFYYDPKDELARAINLTEKKASYHDVHQGILDSLSKSDNGFFAILEFQTKFLAFKYSDKQNEIQSFLSDEINHLRGKKISKERFLNYQKKINFLHAKILSEKGVTLNAG